MRNPILLSLTALLVLPILAAEPASKQIVIEDARPTGDPVRLVLPVGHTKWIDSLRWSPDEKFVASAAFDESVKLWEVSSGRAVQTWNFEKSIKQLAFSRDGSVLWAGDFVGRIYCIDPQSTAAPVLTKMRFGGSKICVLADGNLAVTGSDGTYSDGKIRIYDAQSEKALVSWQAALRTHGYNVQSLQVSRDGKSLAAFVDGGSKTPLRVYDPAGKVLKEWAWPLKSGVSGLDWNNDNSKILALSDDGKTLIFTVNGTAAPQILAPIPGTTLQVARFSQGGKTLLYGTASGALLTRDLQTGKVTSTWKNPQSGDIKDIAFSPLSQKIASGGGSDAVTLWQNGTPRTISSELPWTRVVGSTRTGQMLLAADDGRFELRDLAGGGTQLFRGNEKPISAAAISPDGRRILGNDWKDTLWFWDAKNPSAPRVIGTRKGTAQDFGSLGFAVWSDDASRVAASSREKQMVFGAPDFKPLPPLQGMDAPNIGSTFRGTFIGAAFGPDNRTLYSCNGEFLRAHDTDSGKQLWKTKSTLNPKAEAPGSPLRVAVSPDGKTIAAAGFNVIRLFEAATGAPKSQYLGKGLFVRLAFSPDSQKIYVAGSHLVILDADGKTLKELPIPGSEGFKEFDVMQHDVGLDVTRGLGISEDGYKQLRVWRLDNGKELFRFVRLPGDDWLAYTPDGQFDGSPGALKNVSFARGTQIYALDQFAERFYRPGLMRLLTQAPNENAPMTSLAQAVSQGAPPVVKITSPTAGAAKTEQIEVSVEASAPNGVKAIRLYHNGRLVGGPPNLRGIVVEAAQNNNFAQKFNVALAPGDNVLRTVAYSQTDLESRPDEVKLQFAAAAQKPALHVVCVGINQYRDATMELSYARPDAEALAQFFQAQRANKGLFSRINVTSLLDEAATGEAIQNALKQIAQNAKPEDVAVIYLAGHGETAADSAAKDDDPASAQSFYFLPAEMRQMVMKERVRQFGLSGKTIDELVSKIPARKIILIYDACKSGAAVAGATRGSSDEQQALAMLARAQGIHVLTASTGQQYANEVKSLGHGILTYALLEGLGGKAAGTDSIVKVSQLFAYTEERVPELAKQYRGREQWPVPFSRGQNFPLTLKGN